MSAENALAETLVRLLALRRSESDWQTEPDGALFLVLALKLNVSLGRQIRFLTFLNYSAI